MIRLYGIVCCFLLSCLTANGQTAFTLGGYTIRAGEKKSFVLPIRTVSGDSTFIPMTVVHGQTPGPVLGLIAGIHGYEYPPILALQRLPELISPQTLKGTIIFVHIANVRAFLGRSVFYNPADGKNLNRAFPGHAHGTLTDVIAHTLTNTVIARCNYLVDIHAGDASEDLHPYVGYYVYGSQTRAARQMVDALGFPWVIVSENGPKKDQPTLYCTAEAVARDIPAVAIEYGKLGQATEAEADFINARLLNMMKSLTMLPGPFMGGDVAVEIKKRQSITSEHTGIFYPACQSGAVIRKGMKLGYITDFFGRVVAHVVSPVDGFVIYLSSTPPVNRGDTLFSLAVTGE